LQEQSYKGRERQKAEAHWRAPPRGCPVRNRGRARANLNCARQ